MITEDEIEDDYVYTIDILYGPTNVCGAVKHRTGRIDHVKAKLEEQGFNVNLRRISDHGRVAFAFEGTIMFACAAKNLSFGGCSSFDPLAEKVMKNIIAERNHAVNRARGLTRNRINQQEQFNLFNVRRTENPMTVAETGCFGNTSEMPPFHKSTNN